MKAILSKEKNEFVLALANKGSKKVFYKTAKLDQNIERLMKILKSNSREEFLSSSLNGDKNIHRFERNYENGNDFDFDTLEKLVGDFSEDGNYSESLIEQLRQDYYDDLAAASIEAIFENFVYEILSQLKELEVNQMEIQLDGFNKFDRFLELIGENASLVDIKVNLIDGRKQ